MDVTGRLAALGRKAREQAERAAQVVAPAVREAGAHVPGAVRQAADAAAGAVQQAAERAPQAARAAGHAAGQAVRDAAEKASGAARHAAEKVPAAAQAARQAVDRAAPAVIESVEKAAPAVADAALEAAQAAAKSALRGKRPAAAVAGAAKSAAKSAASRAGAAAAKTVAQAAVANAADMRDADARPHTVRNARTGQDVVVEAYVKGPQGTRDYARVYPAGAKDDFGPVGNKAVGALLVMAGLPMLVLPGPGAAAIAAGMYYLRKASHQDVVQADVEVSDAADPAAGGEAAPRGAASASNDSGEGPFPSQDR